MEGTRCHSQRNQDAIDSCYCKQTAMLFFTQNEGENLRVRVLHTPNPYNGNGLCIFSATFPNHSSCQELASDSTYTSNLLTYCLDNDEIPETRLGASSTTFHLRHPEPENRCLLLPATSQVQKSKGPKVMPLQMGAPTRMRHMLGAKSSKQAVL